MRRSALIALACLLATVSGCSREKIDWKSAEAADTVEGYDHFVERHPDSALVTQARTRVAQLNEDRDWKKATAADTADAYRQFLAQHESGKWGEEARIRIENFSLDGTAGGPAKPLADATSPAAAVAPPTVAASAHASKETQPPAAPAGASPSSSPVASATPSVAGTAKPAPAPAVKATPPDVASAKSATATSKPAPAPAKHLATATPVAAKPAAAAATPPPSNPFGIQLGAFRSQDAALKNWKQLQAKYGSDLHGLFAHAVPVKQGSDQLFRLQAPVGEESRARAICASLAKQSQPCVIVLPSP
jgi:cell division septation protein DedD